MAILPRQYEARISKKHKLTSSVFHLIFEADRPLDYQPGQYASLLIGPHRRPMSFAAPPQGTRGEFLIDVSPGGVASQWAKKIEEGEPLHFLSPYGQFTANPADTHSRVFIATGTGIAPIRSQLLTQTLPLPTILIFGTRVSTLRFFDEEFKAISEKIPTFTFLPVCQVPDSKWAGSVGHVGEIALQHIPHPTQSILYICGGQLMVQEVREMLSAQGVPASNIRTEKFGVL